MPLLPSPELPRPISPRTSKRNNCCSPFERCCCVVATWGPVCIVYGATLWAIYVNAYLISISSLKGFGGWSLAILALTLYGLCIWSFSVAVFTDPGSPLEADHGYSYLPQWQPIKNDGRARYCQKCNYRKPDRTHHCSICRRCILKMDHHCPWLGNCIGFGNYKAFILFLIYLSLFCLECCIKSAWSVWYWISYVTPNVDYLPVQWILLTVISGVVAICVGGFGTWHIVNVCRNVTTIESLEKTRYVHTFPSHRTNRRSSNDTTNIFDVGRRKNWEQVMGDEPLKWFIPVINSLGNGLAFPIREDVRDILRGMRRDIEQGMEGSAMMDDDDDEEDTRVYRRDEPGGRWMMHD